MEIEAGTPQKLLFIGGLGRSGSTLIEKLLNEFNDAFAIGESVHLWERGLRDNELCGCGEAFAATRHCGSAIHSRRAKPTTASTASAVVT